MPSEVVVELMRGVEEGVVFMGVAFRGLPVGRSQLRLPQSRDRALQGSTHYGYCVHGSHLLPMDHDHGNDRTPATRCAIGIKPVAVSLSNAPPTATPSSVMGRFHLLDTHAPRRRGATEPERAGRYCPPRVPAGSLWPAAEL
jgi:hypothetical protein